MNDWKKEMIAEMSDEELAEYKKRKKELEDWKKEIGYEEGDIAEMIDRFEDDYQKNKDKE